MATVLFSKMLEQGATRGFRYGDIETRDFFRDKALQVLSRNASSSRFIKRGERRSSVTMPTIGRMVMYQYDPKHKDTLPYYDRFPMIFPIEMYSDGWLGANLHYLPPVYRARLMDALYDTINNENYDDSTKLQINYQTLKSASKFKYFVPCIKRYLFSHVRSGLVEIDPKEWDYVLMMPYARFMKEKQRKVWDDSIKIIQNRR